jgi:hypothetical protein
MLLIPLLLVSVQPALPQGFLEYREAAERYQRCEAEARHVVAAFAQPQLRDFTVTVRRLDPEWPARPAPHRWTPALIAAAIVMHTHLVVEWKEDRGAHLRAARQLLALLSPEDPEYAIVVLWHVAVSAFLQGAGDTLAVLEHVRLIPGELHEDVRIAVVRALADEMVASPLTAYSARRRIARVRDPDRVPEWMRAQREVYRQRAIAGFRKVIAKDPKHAEAAIRLGFLLEAAGARDEAERLVDSVRGHIRETELQYYAALLAGRLRDRDGDFVAAEREYRAASRLVPHSQTAAVARAHVLVRSGRRAEAASLIARQIERPFAEDTQRDPWLDYPTGQYRKLEELLAGIAREAHACSR